MAGVFINYRRDEEGDRAQRVYEVLRGRVGADRVFIDFDMKLGVDFHEQLGTEVGRCNVVLAVLGRGWTEVKAADGSRALDDPRDWVRVELETALERPDVLVIPVLVGGAEMPAEEELPATLRHLVRRQGRRLRHDSFEPDAQRLAEAVEHHLSQLSAQVAGPSGGGTEPLGRTRPVRERRPAGPSPLIAALRPAGAALLGAAVAAWPVAKLADVLNRGLRSALSEDAERVVRLAIYRGVFWMLVAAAAVCAAELVTRDGRATAAVGRAALVGLLAGAVAGAATQALRNAGSEADEILPYTLLGAVVGASGVAGTASVAAGVGGLIGGLLGGWYGRIPREAAAGAAVPALLIVGGAVAGAGLAAWRQHAATRG